MHNHHVHHELPKAVLLGLGIMLMIPIASAWDNMLGSVQQALGVQALHAAPTEDTTVDELEQELQHITQLIEARQRNNR